MDSQTLISITAIVVSGIVGVSGVVLNIRKYWESDSIDRAARRTMALQMLSDEEYALSQVQTECKSIELLVVGNRENIKDSYDHLKNESERIVRESGDMIEGVKIKRTEVENKITEMSSPEIEKVISDAYHGRMRAEAQLKRTARSRDDTVKLYFS